MIHPHDTDRILGVLGDAIEKLREVHYGYSREGAQEVANDLALLHGAVSAERNKADEEEQMPHRASLRRHIEAERLRQDVAAAKAESRFPYRHREEIEKEVLNGEYRDDPWEDGY